MAEPNIRPVTGQPSKSLEVATATAYEKLLVAARMDGILPPSLEIVSGYRTPETQERLWQAELRKYGTPSAAREWVAPPGESQHQTGRAIDFRFAGVADADKDLTEKYKLTSAWKWLRANAAKYGFTPYEKEPWHWVHAGVDDSRSEGSLIVVAVAVMIFLSLTGRL